MFVQLKTLQACTVVVVVVSDMTSSEMYDVTRSSQDLLDASTGEGLLARGPVFLIALRAAFRRDILGWCLRLLVGCPGVILR